MLIKYTYRLIIFLLISADCFSQTFISWDFLKAVDNDTRTMNGVPGANYFQNHAEYIIRVSFNPKNGLLNASAAIKYVNNSPDTLRSLVFRLYQNINKKGGIRDTELDPSVLHDGVRIRSMRIAGKELVNSKSYYMRTEGTNLMVNLSQPLVPGSSEDIDVEWSFTMPQIPLHRYGKYNENSYFVAYWYPQIAVYDDLNGWDRYNYTDTHEFYNDFNFYDVRIRVPGQYLVWATGDWQNPDEILSVRTLERLNNAFESDSKVEVVTREDIRQKAWMRHRKEKVYHFTAGNIPDFAFAVSNNYVWDAVGALVDTTTGKRVLVQAVYPVQSKYFDKVAEIGKEVIEQFSFGSYGIPYPYPVATVFNGEGGMEFPMMANNGTRLMWSGTVFLTMHELAHAYFPFLTGINERRYSWLDEGLTTYLPVETEKALKSSFYPIETIVQNYESCAGTADDIPLYVPSYQTREFAYQYYTYMRSSIALYMMEKYLGRDVFRSAIREFIDIWKYKHPSPYDLFAILKNSTEDDIDWFIDAWFFKPGWPDLGIADVTKTGNTLRIRIVKKGNMPVPVRILIRYREAEDEFLEFGPEVWKETSQVIVTHQIIDEVEHIRINGPDIPDRDRADNFFRFPKSNNETHENF
jgi:hypothetical protein